MKKKKLLMSMLLVTLAVPQVWAETLTVANNSATSSNIPVCCNYFDGNTMSQTIYSATMLNDVVGNRITSIKYHASSALASSLAGAVLQISTGETTESTIPGDGTYYDYGVLLTGLNANGTYTIKGGETEIEFVLSEPIIFSGDKNLAIEVKLQASISGYTSVNWLGENQDGKVSVYARGYSNPSNNKDAFMPKTTFTYEAATTDPIIKVDNDVLNFSALVGSSVTSTVAVTGKNLTGDITAAIAGDGFSVNTETLGTTGGELTITYAPTVAGTHTGTLTLSSDGAQDVVVNLNGNAVDPVISGTVTPAELTFETYENVAATQAITIENTGNTAFTPVFSGIEAPFSIAEATEIAAGENKEFTVTYAPTAVGSNNGTLMVDINGLTTNVSLNGTASEAPAEITLADGNDQNSYVPINGWTYDYIQINQMIYPSSELAVFNGKKIKSITFYSPQIKYNGGKYNVSVGLTDQERFTSSPARITSLTTVATDLVAEATAGETELTITFNEPFTYENNKNLVVEFEVTEAGQCDPSYSNLTYFYGKTYSASTYPSYNSYKSSSNSSSYYATARNFLPKTTFTFEKEEEPAAVEATLAQIEGAEGVVGTKYAITDEYLVAVEKRDVDVDGTGYVYVWCKDNDNVTDRLAPAEGVIDFMQQQGVQGDWDQSNWVVLRFKGDDQEARSLKNCKLTNVIGTYVDAENYMIDVESYEKGESAEYTPNVYCVANFNAANWGAAGVQQEGKDSDAPYYFFMTPKAQEVCEVTFAEWNGSSFQVPTESGFSGALTLGWTYNQNSDGTPMSQETVNLEEGKSYKFNAIVMRSASKGAINGGSVVYPTNLTGGTENDVPTAISTVGVNGMVESVKYYNVAGVESNEPFDGVNIVVTRYSDGSTTTTKVLK